MTEGSHWRPADEIDVGDVESEELGASGNLQNGRVDGISSELGGVCAKDNSSDTDSNDSDSSEGSDDSSEGSGDFDSDHSSDDDSDLESDLGAEDGEDMDVDNGYDFL